ncbi:hypothetical protein KRP22_011461 [Phytophthora ramorum]|nr:hypothetical protein KRP22_10664 [Phytophthora ramorum]
MASKNTSTERITATSFLTQSNQLCVELSKFVMDPVEVHAYLERFAPVTTPSSESIQSFAKLHHKASDGDAIKMKMFGTDQTAMFNEHIRTFAFDKTVKLINTTIMPIASVPQTADRIDLVTRFTYRLLNHSNGALQVDLVRSLTNPLEFATKLTSAKEQLVDVPLAKMDPSAYDYVLTALARVEKESTSQDNILDLINDVTSIEGSENSEYQESIYQLARDVYRDAVTISQFKRQSGLNYDYVQKVFEANHFKLVKTDGFGSLLRSYKKQNARGYNSMTTEDREYVSLYGYMIFERV